MEKQLNRIYGLDVLRALAISLVVVSHTTYLLFPISDSTLVIGVRVMGAIGVDLFFVLSGFLIGRILLKQLENKKTALSDLMVFWKRRWLRTLPNYMVVLIINILIFLLLNKSLVGELKLYPLFLQNLTTAHPDFFTEAWSLSVEEYAYLVLPMVLYLALLFFKKKNSVKLFLWITIAFIVFGVFLKINFYYTVKIHSYKEWSDLFRKVVIYRLDAIYIGFLLIYIYREYSDTCKKYRKTLGVIGGVVFLALHVSIAVFNMQPQIYLAFYVFVYLQLLVISLGMFFPYFLELKQQIILLKKVVEYISTRSYAIYLTNYSIVLLSIQRITAIEINSIGKLLLFFGLTILLSELIYRFVELPVLQYRDKKYKR
ncbi:MAG: acyltransferase [Flavobacteriaceae bacterium]|nr:acyltransferase [Flavobacteriaceae bacterium]